MKFALLIILTTVLTSCAHRPSEDELHRILAIYADACVHKDIASWRAIVTKEHVEYRERELKRTGETLKSENFCWDKWLRDSLQKTEGTKLRVEKDFARLILYRKADEPVRENNESEAVYAFFKTENNRWKLHGHVRSGESGPIDQLKLDEAYLGEQYQMRRHQFRFIEYDFVVVASITKRELDAIIGIVREKTKEPIRMIRRAQHPTDIEAAWIQQGKVTGRTFRTADPEADDVLIDVSTSASGPLGAAHGGLFLFEKKSGEWFLKSEGAWIE